MYQIQLHNVSKKFLRTPIFKSINFDFTSNTKYCILGYNGSGKSTLLKMISDLLFFEEGEIIYKKDQKAISKEHVYTHFSFVAPYINILETLSLNEMLTFHYQFKKCIHGIDIKTIITDILQMSSVQDSAISLFSSGMKQKVKLALAILSKLKLLIAMDQLVKKNCWSNANTTCECFKFMKPIFNQIPTAIC